MVYLANCHPVFTVSSCYIIMCRLFKTMVGAEPSDHILPLGMQFLFPELILRVIMAHAKLGLVPKVPKTKLMIARLSCLFHSLKASGSVVPITRRLTVPKTLTW